MTFVEACSQYRKSKGLPGGKAPKKGTAEYNAVKAMMGPKKMTAAARARESGPARSTRLLRKAAKEGRLSAKRMKELKGIL